MDKIIIINGRQFMSLVGPGGWGKTRLRISMLASSTTFYTKRQEFYHFYTELQPLFKVRAEKLNIEFVPCLAFEVIEKIEICLLVIDDRKSKSIPRRNLPRKKTLLRSLLQEDIKNFAFSSMIICLIRAIPYF